MKEVIYMSENTNQTQNKITKNDYIYRLAPSLSVIEDIIQRPEEYVNNPLVFYKEYTAATDDGLANVLPSEFSFYRAIFVSNCDSFDILNQTTKIKFRELFFNESSEYKPLNRYIKSGDKHIMILINDSDNVDSQDNLSIKLTRTDIEIPEDVYMLGVGF